jgi:hypothetical protein
MSLVLTRCSPSCSAVPRPLLGAAGDDGGVELTADFLASHCFQRADELGAVACVGADGREDNLGRAAKPLDRRGEFGRVAVAGQCCRHRNAESRRLR